MKAIRFLLIVALVAPLTIVSAQDFIPVENPPTFAGTYYAATGTFVPANTSNHAATAADLGLASANSVGAPTYAGQYDFATGTMSAADSSGGSSVIFDNSASNGSFFTAGNGIIVMDWGTLATGSGVSEVNGVQIGYATSTVGTVDMVLRVHEGADGFSNPGTNIAALPLTGLPGSADGNPAAWVLDLDLTGLGLVAVDGAFGWSYQALDDDTGPLLSGPPNADGVEDAFDMYDSAMGYMGTFWFGGPPAPMASFYVAATSPATCDLFYDNTAMSGSLFTGGANTPLLDWGTLDNDANVCSMDIAYATSSATPVDLNVRFHTGNSAGDVGWGNPGDSTVFNLTGLPESVSGGFEAYLVNVVFDPPLRLTAGVVGWSYEALDADTGPMLTGNGPGTEDVFDMYDGSWNHLGSFWFGGPPNPKASFYAGLHGEDLGPPPPPPAWLSYGDSTGNMNLTGDGDGTPGSMNTITIKGTGGQDAQLVAGITMSDLDLPSHGVTLYAFPWNFRIGGLPLSTTSGKIDLTGALPANTPVGLQLYFQAFAPNLAGALKHSPGLELTVQ
ncbi:MAG: hypothetical protein VX916_05615 [Planctomycetota bacterium]|nr:hypothetical protein [Planctomycetota bacterium]